MRGQSCRTPNCFKSATRKGLCSMHYARQYRAARAKRAAAAARENATCAAAGCSRPLGKGSGRGFCHACVQKQWRDEQRLGGVEKPQGEARADFWRLAKQHLPLEVCAHEAELRLTDSVVAELLDEARRRRIDFANFRFWYDDMLEFDLGQDPEPWERARYVAAKQGPQPRSYKVEPKEEVPA
jgi:hypothetical protein